MANYDYGLYYYFYQDGTIKYEVKATGELNTHVLAEDEVGYVMDRAVDFITNVSLGCGSIWHYSGSSNRCPTSPASF